MMMNMFASRPINASRLAKALAPQHEGFLHVTPHPEVRAIASLEGCATSPKGATHAR